LIRVSGDEGLRDGYGEMAESEGMSITNS
jgi:hypothetical protein